MQTKTENCLLCFVFVSVLLSFPLVSFAQARSFDDGRTQRADAEKKIVTDMCSKTDAQSMLKLSSVGFESDEGLVCAQKVIIALSIDRIAGDPGLFSASDVLWRVVERAILRVDRRKAIRELLEKIRLDLDHPLRSDAWLALRLLEREEGTLIRQGSPLRSTLIPATHFFALLPPDLPAIKQRLDASPPIKRDALIWLLSERWRDEVNRVYPYGDKNSSMDYLRRLAGAFGKYGSSTPEMLAVFVDELFTDYLVLGPESVDNSPHGNNHLPEMSFNIKGSVCSDGDACRSVDTNSSSATNIPYIQTTPLNDTISQSQIFVPFLYNGHSDDDLRVYRGAVQSFVGGGRWTKHSLIGNILMDAGDGTASVNYNLEGIAKIPACTDPLSCTVQVEVVSAISPSNNEAGTSSSLQLDGPTGLVHFPAGTSGRRLIDRSLGDHTLTVKLSRSASHKGSCCAYWGEHSFHIAVRKPGPPGSLNIFGTPPQMFKLISTPGVDPVFAGSLQGFDHVSQQLQFRILDQSHSQPINFGGLFPPSIIAYDHRFAQLWARAAFIHLALQWPIKEFSPAEINELATLRSSVSARARAQLGPPLLAELQAWSFAYEALDPTPILLVIGALVRNTGLTQPLDDAEAKIVGRIAKNASGELAASLNRAKQALDAIRNGQPKLDAILSLLTLEEEFIRKGREARTKYDRLGREIAQLNQGPK